jgi:hypothetical protein
VAERLTAAKIEMELGFMKGAQVPYFPETTAAVASLRDARTRSKAPISIDRELEALKSQVATG